jgi:hypothetical protein
MLSQPIITDNFMAMQSALLTVGSGAISTSVTFTLIPSTQRITYKLANTGTKTAYIAGSNSSNIIAAIASSSTPMPTSLSISNCNAIPGGAILTEDFPGNIDTISAICASGNNTTLEISIGGGQ